PAISLDKELPDPFLQSRRNKRNVLIFFTIIGISFYVIVNYEKTSAPIVSSTFYYLRRSKVIRDKLGSNIDYASFIPWINGTLNQVDGFIDIDFKVKGSLNEGVIKLFATRPDKNSVIDIKEWTLTVDGEVIDLLDDKSVQFVI
ncbi:Coa1p, partial [Ascoidea rubescens DSM 1968]